jgi:hypothetical protein
VSTSKNVRPSLVRSVARYRIPRALAALAVVLVLAPASAARAQSAPRPSSIPGQEGHAGGRSGAGAGADAGPTENWYQYFCGPGWDPQVLVPCGVHGNGAPYHGCRNSVDPLGGALTVGSGDAAADDVVLLAYDLRPGALTIVLQGPQKTPSGIVFGDGIRCVSGPLRRLYTGTAAGGQLAVPLPGEPSVRTRSAALGDPIPSPGVRYYQAWYRDGAGHFNVTSGLQIDWP